MRSLASHFQLRLTVVPLAADCFRLLPRFAGTGYSMAPCNASDERQQWRASRVGIEAATREAAAVNIHKMFVKNGTAQQVGWPARLRPR